MKESSLAADLKQVLDSFSFRKSVTMRLNNWIYFAINQRPSYGEIMLSVRGEPFKKAEDIQIMPNQTLIVFDFKRTLSLLSEECSPIVVEGLHLINPLKSFSQICVEHGFAYSEILKVAKHLVFWS